MGQQATGNTTSNQITSHIRSHHNHDTTPFVTSHRTSSHILHHIASHHITQQITSKHATLHRNTSHHIKSHHVTSCHVMSYIITCRPPPRITWKKNGQNITHEWNFFEIPDAFYGRLLKIINVSRDLHQDVYTCEAENSQSSGYPIVYTINLNVEGKLREPRSQDLRNEVEINTLIQQYVFVWIKQLDKTGQYMHTLFDKQAVTE